DAGTENAAPALRQRLGAIRTFEAMDYASCRSLPAMFFATAQQRADRPFLWPKRDGSYRPLSWGEVESAVTRLARALFAYGIQLVDSGGVKFPVHGWDEALDTGAAQPDTIAQRVDALAPDDIACIIYTSGTGGAPKGVLLTHRNIIANCYGAYKVLEILGLGEEVFLSFLPLSHSYEHTAGMFFPISIGAEIYFAEGADTLAANLLETRPTIMTAVPRLYETMHQRIQRQMQR